VDRDRGNLQTKTGMDKHVDLLHVDFKMMMMMMMMMMMIIIIIYAGPSGRAV